MKTRRPFKSIRNNLTRKQRNALAGASVLHGDLQKICKEAAVRDVFEHIANTNPSWTPTSPCRPNLPTYGWLICEFWDKNNPSADDMTGQVFDISSENQGHRLRDQVVNNRGRGMAAAVILTRDELYSAFMKYQLAGTGVTWGGTINL